MVALGFDDVSPHVANGQVAAAVNVVLKEALLLGNANAGSEDIDLSVAGIGPSPIAGATSMGNAGGDTIRRLREGIERFLITDINNPAAGAKGQSEIFTDMDLVSTEVSLFNHIPGGCNVLYMDGHVGFVKYLADGPGPINAPMAYAIAMIGS
jgi:prepilin-type processing-associated H-X9-DG protein